MARLEILLVDDDPMIRHVIADELEEAGHFVTAVAGGEAALELLVEKPALDLVLIDYTMPGMSGTELVREVKSRYPDLRMAILTGHLQWPPGGETPSCPVITKGVRMSELIKAVEAAAQGLPIELPNNATATRLDLFVHQMTTEPVAGGVAQAMHVTYDSPGDDIIPDAMSDVLGRLSQKA